MSLKIQSTVYPWGYDYNGTRNKADKQRRFENAFNEWQSMICIETDALYWAEARLMNLLQPDLLLYEAKELLNQK